MSDATKFVITMHLSLLFTVGLGCAVLPQAEETTRLCIDGWDCIDLPVEYADFVVDYVREDACELEAAVVILELELEKSIPGRNIDAVVDAQGAR